MTPYYQDDWVTIYHGDCRDVMPALKAIDLVLTDPPYPAEYQHLFGEMAAAALPLTTEGASLVTLCGQHQLPEVLWEIAATGWRYWWTGGMRHTVYRIMPGKWVVPMWKPAIWFVNGGRRKGDTRTPFDLMEGERRDKRYHEWGQPIGWFAHWMENLSSPDGIVLDPFMGAGTTLLAARRTGRRAIGIEIEEQHCETAVRRIRDLSDLTLGLGA